MKTRCPNCLCAIELVDLSAETLPCPSCGSLISFLGSAEETTIHDAHQDIQLAHFNLQEKLGSGQFGTVWKAYDTILKREVAIKVLHHGLRQREQLEAFFREARTVARLQHPHIVQVFEVGNASEPYIVSELILGSSMKEQLASFVDRPQRIAELCAKLARALAHAHEQGIVHRDLKPANILLDEEGDPHIADFGLAKFDAAEVTIATDGQVLGTPAYMSPEQAAGKSHYVTPESDLYSLGVILFELLTGTRPFRGGKTQLTIQIQRVDPPDPRAIRATIPRELSAICLKCLEKAKERRYATGIELAEDLEAYLRNEPITARPWPLSRRIARTLKRRSWPLAMTAILLLITIVIAGALRAKRPDWWATAPVVSLTTEPAEARVLLTPLDEQTLRPQPDLMIDAGKSPIRRKLPPGRYLVTAYVNETRFHEVIRTIPDKDAAGALMFRHRQWKRDQKGVVELPAIRLFQQEDFQSRMLELPERTSEFQIEGPPQSFRVPGFFVDPHELNQAEVQLAARSLGIDVGSADEEPAKLSFDQSVAILEVLGKRLPNELELLRIQQDPAWSSRLIGLNEPPAEWTYSASRFTPGRVVTIGSKRNFVVPQEQAGRVGFRGARSIRPRKTAADFVTELKGEH